MEEFEMSKNKIKVKVCGTEFNILRKAMAIPQWQIFKCLARVAFYFVTV